jgi:hypothetical protein
MLHVTYIINAIPIIFIVIIITIMAATIVEQERITYVKILCT